MSSLEISAPISPVRWSGTMLALFAILLFSVHDALVKWLALGVHPFWIFACVQAGVVVTAAVVLWRRQGAGSWRPSRFPPVLLRAGLGMSTGLLSVWSIAHTPLADLYALVFLKPVLASLIAWWWLKERATRTQMVALGLGTLGVLVAFGPFGQAFGWGHGAAVLAVLLSAWGVALTRSITSRDPSEVIVFWVGVLGTLGAVAMAVVLGGVPPGAVVVQAFGMGLVLGLAMLMWTEGLARSSVAAVSVVQYPQLIWGAAIGWWVFDDVPTLGVLVGGCLAALAGFLVLRSKA